MMPLSFTMMGNTANHKLLWLVVAVFLSYCGCPISTQNPVYILNEHAQLVTSSTLQWVSAKNGDFPPESVKGGQNGTSDYKVCRAALAGGGGYHAGQLRAQACRIVVGDVILSYRNYQVLVSIDGAARLEWERWKQFNPLPAGSINVDKDIFVARSLIRQHTPNAYIPSNQTSIQIIRKVLALGGLYLKEQYGTILIPESGQMKRTEGEVLMEHEPVRYELNSFEEQRLRHEVHSQVTLTDQDLEITSRTTNQIFNLTYQSAIYFGKGHSIPTGSEVLINYQNRTREYVHWGVAKTHPEVKKLRLSYQVPLWSQVKVSFSATEIKKNYDYTATLLSHYKDGAILMRPIKGVFQRTSFDSFRPLYGSPTPLVTSSSTRLSDNTPGLTHGTSTEDSAKVKSYRFPIQENEGVASGLDRTQAKNWWHKNQGRQCTPMSTLFVLLQGIICLILPIIVVSPRF
ncbi:protein unzipped-like isoform X2 [Tigriopus californicus]|nr:protein unzipped-like isoform X2 [Tigriopus californicus]XP_059094211.1 protein unzipped-like isoform X2 [Tigriopus californicus]XP_059094212.1 protein unzipped-like isoform X2 [Tigriopus californicus]XP_059094213.1 protein unzipped-like isoform X2 [Tigriopus californicus]